MSKWTPEPWRIDPRASTHIVAGDGSGVASCGGHFNNMMHPDELAARNDANTDRIVVCINGCKGINPAAVPGLLAACKAARNTIECTLDDKEARGDAINWEAANRIMATLSTAIADAERGAS